MHYKNGREAKIGDEVIQVQNGTAVKLSGEKMNDLLKEAWEELEWFQRERMTRGRGRVLRVDRLLQNIESAGCKGDEAGVGGPLREFLDTFEAAREKLTEKVEALVEICRNTKPTKTKKGKQ